MPPRGKIAQLPDELRAWLHKAIVERGYGDIVALTDDLNALCKEGGVAISIGKSAATDSDSASLVRRRARPTRRTGQLIHSQTRRRITA